MQSKERKGSNFAIWQHCVEVGAGGGQVEADRGAPREGQGDQRPRAHAQVIIGNYGTLLGRAATWVRGFVNNFLRVPFACLGSKEAA